jgi:hypothetical protein
MKLSLFILPELIPPYEFAFRKFILIWKISEVLIILCCQIIILMMHEKSCHHQI